MCDDTSAPSELADFDANDPLRAVIRKHWGYDTLRPMQHEAMSAAIGGTDALVVMPTGGGKSLCYQAPALLADKPTVVVSPLIALMKDQVDNLRARDIPAAFLNSSLTTEDRRRVADGILNGTYKLIFVAPERFASEAFWNLLSSGGIGAFAIDEAHCISHWGHDFRSDYRRLDQLKSRFPGASVQAFTATATPHVRQDIIEQLHLANPRVLVGDFFRPNLSYSVAKRGKGFSDVISAVKARRDRAGIVYCIRRRDVDELSAQLSEGEGLRAMGYHAGMSDNERSDVQDAFASGECDVIVATVAFGMGIDRSDIRYVIHAALPKSLEHYQQETGRAGRDGEPAECILYYGGNDFGLWKRIIEGDESQDDHAIAMLSEMYNYATGMTCRHRKLVTYFGQDWDRDSCDACDICNGDVEVLPDSTILAQKIMSGVYRTGERFGAAYVCEVLLGAYTERVEARGHSELSTFGIMRDYPKKHISAWIDQLTSQDLLKREGEYRVLKITPAGWQVLRDETEAKLLQPSSPAKENRAAPVRKRKSTATLRRASELPSTRVVAALGPSLNCPNCAFSLVGNTTGTCPECGDTIPFSNLGITLEQFKRIASKRAGNKRQSSVALDQSNPRRVPEGPLDIDERNLFEQLRNVRRDIADELNVPAFVVFNDKTLRALARAKPTSENAMLSVKGVGPSKLAAFGEQFLSAIRESCA